jgi:hypothetical protein
MGLFYETDYNRGHLTSNFERLTTKDSFMGNYSHLNRTSTVPIPSSSHYPNMHVESQQSTQDYSLAFGQTPSSQQQFSHFSMAVTNPMLYYAHPWMRPGKADDLRRR